MKLTDSVSGTKYSTLMNFMSLPHTGQKNVGLTTRVSLRKVATDARILTFFFGLHFPLL